MIDDIIFVKHSCNFLKNLRRYDPNYPRLEWRESHLVFSHSTVLFRSGLILPLTGWSVNEPMPDFYWDPHFIPSHYKFYINWRGRSNIYVSAERNENPNHDIVAFGDHWDNRADMFSTNFKYFYPAYLREDAQIFKLDENDKNLSFYIYGENWGGYYGSYYGFLESADFKTDDKNFDLIAVLPGLTEVLEQRS